MNERGHAEPGTFANDLDRDGCVVVPDVLSRDEVRQLCDALTTAAGATHAIRNLFDVVPAVRHLPQHPPVVELVSAVLDCDAFAVRGILFDKVPGRNWKVAWHRDQTIAVARRHNVSGFGPWSVKHDVPHVQPPRSVLDAMLTVRLHLDDCGLDNGPLRVIPGSHRDADERDAQGREEVACIVAAGGALLMRPRLLHASSPAAEASHRRVIHLDFAAAVLPEPLRWHEGWPISPTDVASTL